MDVFNWVSAIGTVVAIGLGFNGSVRARRISRREMGSARVAVSIREFSEPTPRAPSWALAEQQLVVSNGGPGDAREIEIELALTNNPEDSAPALGTAQELPYLIVPGGVFRTGCFIWTKIGDIWDPDGIPFPIDVIIKWRDGAGGHQRTVTFNEPEP